MDIYNQQEALGGETRYFTRNPEGKRKSRKENIIHVDETYE